MKRFLWLLPLSFMACVGADSSTTGYEEKHDQQQHITINNNGDNTTAFIMQPVEYLSERKSAADQETAGTATMTPRTTLGYQAPITQADSGAELAADIKNVVKRWVDYRKKDSDNPVTTAAAPAPAPVPVVVVEPDVKKPSIPAGFVVVNPTDTPEDYTNSETHDLKPEGNKQFTWLPKTGKEYGGPVLFEFNAGCGELHVPDAGVTHGKDGNSKNHNQAFYFCGTDFPVGSKENNGFRASVFGPPGCKATEVTIHYNTTAVATSKPMVVSTDALHGFKYVDVVRYSRQIWIAPKMRSAYEIGVNKKGEGIYGFDAYGDSIAIEYPDGKVFKINAKKNFDHKDGYWYRPGNDPANTTVNTMQVLYKDIAPFSTIKIYSNKERK